MFGFFLSTLFRATTVLTLIEGASPRDLSIVLAAEPTDTVFVVLQYETARFESSADTIIFLPANYSTPQTVTLTATDDGNDNRGIDTLQITYNITSTDTKYNNYAASGTQVRIFDNAYSTNTLNFDMSQEFHFTQESELEGLRTTLKSWIFQDGYPASGADSVTVSMTYNTYMNPAGMTGLSQVDRLAFIQREGFTDFGYHLIPTSRNNKLMISLYGHADAYDGAGDGTPTSLAYWIGLGYDVLTSHMTARGENVSPFSHLTASARHDSTQVYEGEFNPLELYLAPTIRALNHLDSVYNYDNIYMMGISGGGWATTIISAMDTRIEKSFAVAGTYPHFVRDDPGNSSQSSGDYEQGHSATRSTAFLRNHFQDTVSYLDMYALCGWQREHWQILNDVDDCCFDGLYWQVYVPEMRRRFLSLSSGAYYFYQYSDSGNHRINTEVLDLINSRL